MNMKNVRICLIIQMFSQEEQRRQSEASERRGIKSTESVQKANVSEYMTRVGVGKVVRH